MALVSAQPDASPVNPLDVLEELVSANEWRFERSSDEEMMVELAGQWSAYCMFFAWQQDLGAMYFSCPIEVRVPAHKRAQMAELLSLVNEKLWLGHFDLCSEEQLLVFRHTVLLRGARSASVEQLEDLVDIAFTECERYYPAFQFLLWSDRKPADALAATMLDTVGEA